MDKKKISLVAVFAIVSLTLTCVTANSLTFNTPLYTLRMEQTSYRMNFLPTAVNGFTFIAEKGCKLTYSAYGNCSTNGYCGGANPLATDVSCVQTHCDTCVTYSGERTCQLTCPDTCVTTCDDPTCPWTCYQSTCEASCGQITCKTCETTEPECESIIICS